MININYLIQILKNENVKNLGVFDKIIKNDILTNINDINITIIDLYQVLESINLFRCDLSYAKIVDVSEGVKLFEYVVPAMGDPIVTLYGSNNQVPEVPSPLPFNSTRL